MWTLLLYIKHSFLGAILDFLGKGSFFNVEIRDTEMYSEPVGQAFKQSEIVRTLSELKVTV